MIPRLPDSAWSRGAAAHLLSRAGFSGPPEEIDALHRLGPEKAVKSLLDGAAASLATTRPEGVDPVDMIAFRQAIKALDEEAARLKRREWQRQERQSQLALTQWWLERLRGKNADPVAEKLALFWHGHFATSVEKVKRSHLMWQQNDTLRREGLGDFGTLTKAIARDPAMLVWLDTDRSFRREPNENFARELLELFTLGEGHYSEGDIHEAARTFTPYKIDPRTQKFTYRKRQEISEPKTIFGQTGDFSGDDVVDLILKKPECAPFIARKLWEFYAFEKPDEKLVSHLADDFRAGGYEIRPLLETIFTSAAFYSSDAVRKQIKSPVQWVMALSRTLEIDLPPARMLLGALNGLGQVPFRPPSVKGWDGGKAWITTATLLLRYNLAAFSVGNQSVGLPLGNSGKVKDPRRFRALLAGRLPLKKIAPPETRQDPRKLVEALTDRLFQQTLPDRETAAFVSFAEARAPLDDSAVRDLLQLMMSTPQYQLT